MSSIFSKLLEESGKQQQQLDSLSTKDNIPIYVQKQSVNANETSANPINRRSDEPTLRPTVVPTVIPNDYPTKKPSDDATIRRSVERVAFDLYQEQAQAIRRLRAERELESGHRVSLSDIAREAFELFLKRNQ